MTRGVPASRSPHRARAARMRRHWQMYLVALLPLAYLVIFKYVPMLGVQIAFKRYVVRAGIWGSPWVGFAQFQKFFSSYQFERVITNTLTLSLYALVAGFPLPILLALMMNASRSKRFQGFVQNVTYMPHFISTVVMVGILNQFFNVRYGGFARLFGFLYGGTVPDLLANPSAFVHMYVWSGVWQGMGWGSVIYMAALAGVDESLHEAAVLDGASRLQRIWHIDLPAIVPTITITLILRCGNLMGIGFDKVFLMQNNLNLRASEVISTYVYKVGLASSTSDFSYSTAIGLFNSVINLTVLLIVNAISRRVGETSLW